MKKIPKKIKHWAKDTSEALDIALDLFKKEYPNPTEDEKLELIQFAPTIAAVKRGVTDKQKIKQAYSFILERLKEDFELKEPDEPVHHSILFLLAYLDTHIVWEFFTENKMDEIMDYLADNYEINFPL